MARVVRWVGCVVLGLAVASTGFVGMSWLTAVRADDTTTTQPVKKEHKGAASQPVKLGEDWDKLGLTADQKTQIVTLRKDLKTDMAKLQADEKAKELALLTPDQQAALKALEEEHRQAKLAAKGAKNGTATQPATQKDSK